MNTLELSKLPKTWIIDLDGTIFPHNGFLYDDIERPLKGVKEIFEKISLNDFIVIFTSRDSKYRELTEKNLSLSGIRYDLLVMNLPQGERILINDSKPSGLLTAYSVCIKRDKGLEDFDFFENENL